MFYQMQEGYLTLGKGDWQDRSVHMLAARHLPVKGTNVVVTREELPAGMGLPDYVTNQKAALAKELSQFKLQNDRADKTGDMLSHYLEFTWDNAGNVMHQMIVVIKTGEGLLILTATTPGKLDDPSRAELLAVMKSFKPGPVPAAKDKT